MRVLTIPQLNRWWVKKCIPSVHIRVLPVRGGGYSAMITYLHLAGPERVILDSRHQDRRGAWKAALTFVEKRRRNRRMEYLN